MPDRQKTKSTIQHTSMRPTQAHQNYSVVHSVQQNLVEVLSMYKQAALHAWGARQLTLV